MSAPPFRIIAKGLTASALLAASGAHAHHSYAMFDTSRRLTVAGTMDKVDWSNPHVTIWIYVPTPSRDSGYVLYGFATGGINIMTRTGWTKDTFKAGEKVTIDYLPLKDGRPGGEFVRASHEDGSVTLGDPAAARYSVLSQGGSPHE